MEITRYKTRIKKDGSIEIPDKLLAKLSEDTELEVVIRPISPAEKTTRTVDEVIKAIEKRMNNEFPGLNKTINREIRAVVGISDDIKKDYSKFSDKEIISIAMMEKYLEKGEIIESLL